VSDAPALDVLLPSALAGRQLPPVDDEAELLDLYAEGLPTDGRTHVRANMVATLDGASTGADRVSGSINGPADYRAFEVLRALADVVLIGAGTARAEGYRDVSVAVPLRPGRRARGLADSIELAVVSAGGDLPEELLTGSRPPLVLTGSGCPRLGRLRDVLPADRLLVVPGTGAGEVDLPAAVAALTGLGLSRVLTEGGPTLLGRLVAAGLVDELCLTWSPLLVGGTAVRTTNVPGWFAPPRPASPVSLLHADGVLLGRWRLHPGTPA